MASIRERSIHSIKGRTSGSRSGGSFLGGTAITGTSAPQHNLESTTHTGRSGALLVRKVMLPAQLLANTDNWAPVDVDVDGPLLDETDVIRAATDATRNLTGIVAPVSGFQALLLYNIGTFDLVLEHDVTSTAANRFLCPGSADLTLRPNTAVLLVYDLTSTRWRVIRDTLITVLQELFLAGLISPAQLVANTDDWAPTGFANATVVRTSTDASRNLTGIAGGAAGRVIVLANVGLFDLVLKHDVTSTAVNRFYCPDDSDMTLKKDSTAILVYDATSSRWRVIGGGGGGGVTDHGLLTGLLDDDHTQYRLESEDHTHASSGPQGGTIAHTALTSVLANQHPDKVAINVIIDGGGVVISTGSKAYIEVPFACTVNAWRVVGNASGAIVVDVKKATYAGLFTTASIAASAKPTLSAAQKAEDTTLTGWTTAIAAGDWLEFVVDSATTVQRVTVSLTVTRT